MNLLRTAGRALGKGVGALLIGLVKVYQYTLSPLLGPRCRFWPSCSAYAIEAVQVHGPLKGGWMALKRIVKCHPGSRGGMDPVPGGRSEALMREDQQREEHACGGGAHRDHPKRDRV